MTALDTNILIRFAVQDDAEQAKTAERLLQRSFQLPPTVLAETEWVLRYSYGWSRAQIADFLTLVLDLETAEHSPLHRWAVARFAAGADLADMLHLTLARRAGGFATFDHKLARLAGDATPVPIELLG